MARLHHRGGGGDVYPDHRTIDQGGPNASGCDYHPHDFGIDPTRCSLFDPRLVVRAQRRGSLGAIVDDSIDQDV